MSVNILQEDGLHRIAGNGGVAEVDSELSETSENPVMNKVVTESINGIKHIEKGTEFISTDLNKRDETYTKQSNVCNLVCPLSKQDGTTFTGRTYIGKLNNKFIPTNELCIASSASTAVNYYANRIVHFIIRTTGEVYVDCFQYEDVKEVILNATYIAQQK